MLQSIVDWHYALFDTRPATTKEIVYRLCEHIRSDRPLLMPVEVAKAYGGREDDRSGIMTWLFKFIISELKFTEIKTAVLSAHAVALATQEAAADNDDLKEYNNIGQYAAIPLQQLNIYNIEGTPADVILKTSTAAKIIGFYSEACDIEQIPTLYKILYGIYNYN